MRLLVLDTETTGLDPKQGHRIIEIAVVELNDRRPTGRHLHFYLNPERDIDAAATEVHGMTWEDLKHRPRFADIAAEFVAFAHGASWVIHNAPFDVAFIDAEFARARLPLCGAVYGSLIDTLSLARDAFPGKRNGLDALCERFAVSNAHRTLHGALLDARLLADVYLAMTRGQETLSIDMGAPIAAPIAVDGGSLSVQPLWTLEIVQPSPDELALHREYLDALDRESKGRCVWLRLEGAEEAAA
ncbi:MAG TPA: DNA polymerase III subunit epsilon [Casimicrobiaceae bacterium]|jgi:DNA polymerase-3 subunit epsilon